MESAITLALNPSGISVEINLPSSKSISNRVLILNALSYSPYDVVNLSDSDDTRVMVQVFDSNSTHFDVGAAGTSMRFLTAFLAKTVGEWTITGSERMKQRPIRILVEALNQLGGKVEYLENEGFPPLKIFGSALTGGVTELDGGVSSQYISALMMIGPYMQQGLKIKLRGKVISKPYIQMTSRMMEDYGAKVDFNGSEITIAPQHYTPVRFEVEPDWSAASYWYEVLALAGEGKVTLKGLRKESYQGDSKVAAIFEYSGIKTTYTDTGVVLTVNPELRTQNSELRTQNSELKTQNSELRTQNSELFTYDFTDVPDLAQTVVVTCCLKNIPFVFSGLQSLKIKETNRVAALINELAKLGYVLEEPAEGELAWHGARCIAEENPVIATYEDHRMAMAFAPVALLRPVTIEHAAVVSKSYPRFWDDLLLLSE